MEITEVRIKLMTDSDDRLQGFCSITFDNSFVVRDLKIIDGTNGPFVAMPSRKLTSHCHQCGSKNHLKAQYCNQCGARQREDRAIRDSEGRAKLYADIAHPINSQCRESIQNRVIAEFRAEQERSRQPGYVSRYDDDYDDDVDTASYTTTDEAHRCPPAPAGLPHGQPQPAQAQPTQSQPPQAQPERAKPERAQPERGQPPAPHILPAAPATGGTPSTGGPHFITNPQREPSNPQRETIKESRETPSKRQPPRDEFGAGIF